MSPIVKAAIWIEGLLFLLLMGGTVPLCGQAAAARPIISPAASASCIRVPPSAASGTRAVQLAAVSAVPRAFSSGKAAVKKKSTAKTAKAVKTTKKTAPQPQVKLHPFKVYLSPSCQTWNPYCDGSGSEEYHMRQIACAMPKYLKKYGIESVVAAAQTGDRSNQKNTIANRAKQAEAEHCDLYLAIHSNARDDGPKTYGPTIFYPSKKADSSRFAQLLAGNFNYPDKSAISIDTKDALWEMYMPKIPHCLIEVAYHDNPEDAYWIEENTDQIAQSLAYCCALYAYVPVNVSLSKNQLSVKSGTTCNLTSKVSLINHNIQYNTTAWSSSNGKVAKVENGKIAGLARGTATITARTSNNLTATCKVTVC